MSSASEAIKGLGTFGKTKGPAPVEKWDPPFCGAIPMRIAADGQWYYMNSPIGRLPLVKLFSSILRREGDGSYVLVTPVEKCGIMVDDAPFCAVRMRVEGNGPAQILFLETSVEDEVAVNFANPLRFVNEASSGGLKPYVSIRRNLEALVSRALFYDLVALGVVHDEWFGVWSSGVFFSMQKASDVQL